MRIKNLKKHAGIPKKSRGKGSLNKEILWFHCFKNAGDFIVMVKSVIISMKAKE